MDFRNVPSERRKLLLLSYLGLFRYNFNLLQKAIQEEDTEVFSKLYPTINSYVIIIFELLTSKRIEQIDSTTFTSRESFQNCEPILTFISRELMVHISDEDAIHLFKFYEEIKRVGSLKISQYIEEIREQKAQELFRHEQSTDSE